MQNSQSTICMYDSHCIQPRHCGGVSRCPSRRVSSCRVAHVCSVERGEFVLESAACTIWRKIGVHWHGGRRGEAGHTVAHHHPLLNSIDESAATLNQGTVRRLPKRRQRGGRGPWAGGIAPAPLLSLSLSLCPPLSLSLSCIGV